VVFNETSTAFFTVDPLGNTASYDLGIATSDYAMMIPTGQNFFLVGDAGRLLGADWSGFSSMAGDILVIRDTPGTASGLVRLYWDVNQLQLVAQPLTLAPGSATSTKWEHAAFAPLGIGPISPPPLGLSSLAGSVYDDLNNDGLKQSGEPAIENVTVTLTEAVKDEAVKDMQKDEAVKDMRKP
jgi:hypothetical protein